MIAKQIDLLNQDVKESACLIFSGGLDSTTLLYKLLSDGYKVSCLTFNYGQKHLKEIDNIPNIIIEAEDHFNLEDCSILHEIIDLSNISTLIAGKSALMDQDEMPNCHYTAESAKKTIVPGRNLMMLSIAASICEAQKTHNLYYAAHAGDWAVYPDCRPGFVEASRIAIARSSEWDEVKLHAPFLNLAKSDIVALGIKLGVPFELTWSCYNGREKACGKCPTCTERLEAFKINHKKDPLEYE